MISEYLTGVGRWVLAVGVVMAAGAGAQNAGEHTIGAVRLEGLDYVADQEQLIQSRLEVRPGATYSDLGLKRAVARDIRRIWDLGYFTHIAADSALDAGGLTIITYLLEEKRLISEILILGADKVKERLIRGEYSTEIGIEAGMGPGGVARTGYAEHYLQKGLTLREGGAFVEEALSGAVEAILALYESKGFANARVDAVAEPAGAGQVRLIFSIDEGRKARIRSINFVGNEVLRDRKLRKMMKTKTAKWFLGGRYEAGKLEFDLEQILDEYDNHGRLDADIASVDIAFTGGGKGMNITIEVAEGPEYRVDILEIADNVVFDDDELVTGVQVLTGDVHDKGQVAADAGQLQRAYRDSGYINAIVTPQVTVDRDAKTTHVVHQVAEGDLKYIRQITVTGNSITKDQIVRRQMLLEPGDRYDGAKASVSEERIGRTGYFDNEQGEPAVRITLQDVPGDGRYTDMFVDVVESGKTRTMNFGLGFSFEQGLGGSLGLKWNNFDLLDWPKFTGGGQTLNLQVRLGEVQDQFNISFTDPEFLGYPLSAGFDIYQQTYRIPDANYRTDTQGLQLRIGKALSPYVTLRVSARYNFTDVNDSSSFSSPDLPFSILVDFPFGYNRELQRARDKNTTISTRWELDRNTIINSRDPSGGSRHRISLELAGFGGDHEFYKVEHDSTWYLPIFSEDKWTLSLRTREGWVGDYGSSDFVPLEARFYAGGTYTVRGYDFRDIGPRETGLFVARRNDLFGFLDLLNVGNYQLDEFSVGGEATWITNAEVKYRLHKRISLFGFVDAGAVWRASDLFDLGDIRYSVGFGVGVFIPVLGPVRLDYGFPLNADKYQGNGKWHLNTTFLSF